MSSGGCEFQKATLEVRFIPVPHCSTEEIACTERDRVVNWLLV